MFKTTSSLKMFLVEDTGIHATFKIIKGIVFRLLTFFYDSIYSKEFSCSKLPLMCGVSNKWECNGTVRYI
jgi:hypothetical protein